MSGRDFWNFYSAGRIVFGSGSVRRIVSLLKPLAPERVLVVSDSVLASAGILSRIVDPLRAAGIEVSVFDGGEPEPSFELADAAVLAGRTVLPDLVIGLGGGSNMDLAKIVAAVLKHGGTCADYAGFDKVPGPVLPLVCIPTTAGTGSEVSHASILTDLANAVKVSIHSHFLRPDIAVVDPELTLSCPARTTADSGIDTLSHAIEGYTAASFDSLGISADVPFPFDGKQPLADCLAEKAIQLVGQHLVTAVKDPLNLAAREGMSLAALLGGLTFSNSAVAAVHALEYPLGAAVHCSHGAGNGLLLPHVMRYNLPYRIPEFARIAELLGEDIRGLHPEEAALRSVAAVERICREAGIPSRLRDLGATREQLPGLAAKAHAIRRLMILNCRPPSETDLLGILNEAY